jgi:hypothetical protein
MRGDATIISNFTRYPDADAAVTRLTGAGFPLKDLGIIGDGHYAEYEPHREFGERVKLWSMRGTRIGGAGALVLGALFTPASLSGNDFVLSYIAAVLVCVLEGAAAAGCLGLAGALVCNSLERKAGGSGRRSVTRADSYILVARGTPEQTARARALIAN